MMNAEELAKERQRRMAFARAVYERTVSGDFRFANLYEVGESLGFDPATTRRVMDYLNGEGVAQYVVSGGNVALTHAGRVEVEQAISSPDQPTRHFAAINFITIGTMTNSQISQGSQSSPQTQTISLTPEQLGDLVKFVREFRQALPKLNLPEADQREAEAELQTVEAQANSTKPKHVVIKSTLDTLKEILLRVGSSVAAQELLKHLPQHL
jgi:hypothetical protein